MPTIMKKFLYILICFILRSHHVLKAKAIILNPHLLEKIYTVSDCFEKKHPAKKMLKKIMKKYFGCPIENISKDKISNDLFLKKLSFCQLAFW